MNARSDRESIPVPKETQLPDSGQNESTTPHEADRSSTSDCSPSLLPNSLPSKNLAQTDSPIMDAIPASSASEDHTHLSTTLNILRRTRVAEKLNDHNFLSWCRDVESVLTPLGFFGYLKPDSDDSTSLRPSEPFLNGLTAWLYDNMNAVNASRFRAQMCSNTSGKPKPTILWSIIGDHHRSISEWNLFDATRHLEGLRQPRNVSLDQYIDTFTSSRDNVIKCGGSLREGILGRQLLHSLHPDHLSDVKIILRTLNPITYDSVVKALKEVQLLNIWLKASSPSQSFRNQHTPLTDKEKKSKASSSRRPRKCSPDVCLGPHAPAQCFAKPGNELLEQKRKQALIKSGRQSKCRSNLYACPFIERSFDNRVALWVTGASHHMFNKLDFFKPESLRVDQGSNNTISMAGGTERLREEYIGEVWLAGSKAGSFGLSECLYVPGLRQNVIAGGLLIRKGMTTLLDEDKKGFSVKKGEDEILKGVFENRLMVLNIVMAQSP